MPVLHTEYVHAPTLTLLNQHPGSAGTSLTTGAERKRILLFSYLSWNPPPTMGWIGEGKKAGEGGGASGAFGLNRSPLRFAVPNTNTAFFPSPTAEGHGTKRLVVDMRRRCSRESVAMRLSGLGPSHLRIAS